MAHGTGNEAEILSHGFYASSLSLPILLAILPISLPLGLATNLILHPQPISALYVSVKSKLPSSFGHSLPSRDELGLFWLWGPLPLCLFQTPSLLLPPFPLRPCS